VVEALAWGLVGSATLVLGAGIVMVRDPSAKVLGLVMGFGSGVLVSSLSFEMIEEAADVSPAGAAIGFFAGALVFVGGDTILARIGGGERDASRPPTSSRSAAGLPIVLGSVLDGIPESAALGLSLLEGGGVGLAILAAVFVSNLPESMAASSELLQGGWSRRRVLLMWAGITVVSGLAAATGYRLLDGASPSALAFTLSFAGGAVLAMLTTSMIPEAYERAGRVVRLAVTAGFATAFGIHWLDT